MDRLPEDRVLSHFVSIEPKAVGFLSVSSKIGAGLAILIMWLRIWQKGLDCFRLSIILNSVHSRLRHAAFVDHILCYCDLSTCYWQPAFSVRRRSPYEVLTTVLMLENSQKKFVQFLADQ